MIIFENDKFLAAVKKMVLTKQTRMQSLKLIML